MIDYTEAYMNGWHAHKRDKKSNFNPYNEDLCFYSNNQWNAGYCARRDAVKYGRVTLDMDENQGW